MTDDQVKRTEEAEELARLLRPHIRSDVWSAALTCSVVPCLVFYLITRADIATITSKLEAKTIQEQRQVTNIRASTSDVGQLARDILAHQGKLPNDM